MFGSRGNFFNVQPENLKSGGFQVNPPFIESLFIKTMNILLGALKLAEVEDRSLLFVFFMPGWIDSISYNLAVNNTYLRSELIFPANAHSYYDYKEGKRVVVKFYTHLIILSSRPTIGTLTQSLIHSLRNAFS